MKRLSCGREVGRDGAGRVGAGGREGGVYALTSGAFCAGGHIL